MITEDYVSFEVAKLLKEKEFDEICYLGYNKNGEYVPTSNRTNSQIIQPDFCFICCPTLQMAMKWFLKKYNIFICVLFLEEYNGFGYTIENTLKKKYIATSENSSYKEPEEAVEVAIKYCLVNLI